MRFTAREAFSVFQPSEVPRLHLAPDDLAGPAGRWHCVSPTCRVSGSTPDEAWLRWLELSELADQ